MARKRFAASARDKRARKSGEQMGDRRLDFSDIPELNDEQVRRARRVGRPNSAHPKQLIAIRMDPRLLARLRRLAARQSKPYQTFIHELLELAAKRRVA